MPAAPRRYTLVARKGSCPLYWGSDNGEGDALIISSVPAYLSPFPPGCAFEVGPGPQLPPVAHASPFGSWAHPVSAS